MNAIVFVGPTLTEEAASRELDAAYLPPVSQGDVYRAALRKPRVIGIIDGYFERVPAVWHKEILWAMSQGVHVLGASSMGALRAAELEAFGMVGVGRIFEAFRDGRLEDDDEVTVAHTSSGDQGGFVAASEAMVNIRATLEGAVEEGVVDGATAMLLEQLAKSLHYSQRSYRLILATADDRGAPRSQLAALEAWLPENRVDQKKEDALALLRVIRELLDSDVGPRQASFHFAHTDAWDQVSRRTGRQLAAAIPDELDADLILDELRLDGRLLDQTVTGARSRALALNEARHQGVRVGGDLLQETMTAFFLERGLREGSQIRAWMERQDLDKEGLTGFLEREAKIRWVQKMFGSDVWRQIVDQLRVSDSFSQVAGRAWKKRMLLQSLGLDDPGLDDTGLSEKELLHWFFVERKGEAVPDDLEAHALEYGHADAHGLIQALVRERLFVTLTEMDERD